jgi:hypothetical protein
MVKMPPRKTKAPSAIYQVRVALLDIRPPIWRRVQIPGAMPLCCVHDVLQAVLGWTDSHLHQFDKDGQSWGVPDDEDSFGPEVIDERHVPLSNLLANEGDSLIYLYDFGDGWRHSVTLEKLLPSDPAAPFRPVCLAGERHCPPEDVGGVPGYEEFLEVIFDPAHKEFERMVRWAGGPFQAEEFSVPAVNDILERMRFPKRHRR